MDKKRIIYIEHYAGSPEMGMEFRPYYLSREWVKMGYRVDIIAADYSHLRNRNPKIDHDFQNEIIDGIHYHWIHTTTYDGNGVKRALTMAEFIGKLYLNAKNIAQKWKPDIVITSSTYPLDTYVGQRIKKYSNAILIHEIHDMWPAVLKGIYRMKRINPFVVIMQIAENSFCKHSDYVVSLQPNTKDYLMKHGMQSDKFLNVNNGVVVTEWDTLENLPDMHSDLIKKLKAENKFIICFFGSITISYAIDYLIRAVQKINISQIAVIIVGEENQYLQELKKIARSKKSEIYFLPKVPKRAVPSLLNSVDALYVASVTGWIMQFGISMNKLFDSMMSGKPIIYAMSAPNNYIVKYNCGISVKPESVEALAEGIKELYFMPAELREKLGRNGKEAVIRYFTYEKLSKKFARLF